MKKKIGRKPTFYSVERKRAIIIVYGCDFIIELNPSFIASAGGRGSFHFNLDYLNFLDRKITIKFNFYFSLKSLSLLKMGLDIRPTYTWIGTSGKISIKRSLHWAGIFGLFNVRSEYWFSKIHYDDCIIPLSFITLPFVLYLLFIEDEFDSLNGAGLSKNNERLFLMALGRGRAQKYIVRIGNSK